MGLDTVELVLETEKHFDITFTGNELENTDTVSLFCKLIQQKLLIKKGFRAPSTSAIQEVISNLHIDNYAVDRDKIFPESRFVNDLGLD